MEILTLVAIGVAVSAIAYALLDTFFSEERRVRKRITALEEYTAGPVENAEPLAAPFHERVLKPNLAHLGHAVMAATPSDYLKRIRKRVVMGGGSPRTDPERIVLTKVGVGALAAVVAFMFARGAHLGSLRSLLIGLLAGLVLSFVPDLVLAMRAADRQHKIVRELPDMLDMLTISVEAGLGFDQAVSRYVRHSRGPLGREFGIALMEIQAGKSRREALRSMAERADVQELRTFVMAIVQADVFGVSVSDVLRTQSREMRVKRRQRAEELAQKAPAKMAFPLVVCVLPATIIVVITPAIVGLIHLFRG
jgi:tight adherence protein C